MLDLPLSLRSGLTVPNRLAMAPLTNTQSHSDGTLDEPEYRWLERRARGGFGWISTCAAFVSEEGHAWDGQLGIASDAHLPGLRRLAEMLRTHGTASVVQLHHGGVQANLAPEKLSTGGPEGARAATEADLERVREDFVAAALRAKEAGFDGVELHGANGYLFTQFLAPEDNPRTDRYGGALENRARLLRETARAVREAVGPELTVGARISPVDSWSERGLILDDSLQLGRWLAEDGLDFVHLSLGDVVGTPPKDETDDRVITTAFREALPDEVALFAVGGVWTREDAVRAREAGADVVVVGKAAIGNPDWAQRVLGDQAYEPSRNPWTEEALRAADVGEDLIAYLRRFRMPMVR